MTKTFKRIIITAIVFIALAGAACALVISGACSSTNPTDPLGNVRNDAINTVLDASGIKGRIDSELRSKAGELAEQAGIPQSVVDDVVDSLAIEDWEATTLPEGATETGTYAVDADGTAAQITTYDDPGIVTVDAYGQSVTMAVPESAQDYVPYLQYLQYLQ